MRFKILCVLLGVGFGILGAGCQTGRGFSTGRPTCRFETFPTGAKKPVVDPRNGEISTRWIGLRSPCSRRCPKVEGWQGEPLLSRALAKSAVARSGPARDDLALIQELGLDRFCVYTPEPGSDRPFVAPPNLKAARDRLAISTAGEDLVPRSPLTDVSHLNRVDQALSEEFLRETGQLPPDSGLPSGPPNVQITFLDTEPDGPLASSPPTPPGPQHGFAVAHLAQELVCKAGDGLCAATVLSKRALNYQASSGLAHQLPSRLPGSIGTISDLAVAIAEAVLACPSEKRLILNLSIGWDGEADLDGNDAIDRDPAVQSVYAALQFAAREGVLVIAAAGNRRGGGLDDSNWPILPAAWDLWPAGKPSKLVYAVGGVDWQGLPLPNSRTNALPVRVAYGDHATLEVGNHSGVYTTVYTGSSVSTAVVSAAAAVIWHLLPDHRRPRSWG